MKTKAQLSLTLERPTVSGRLIVSHGSALSSSTSARCMETPRQGQISANRESSSYTKGMEALVGSGLRVSPNVEMKAQNIKVSKLFVKAG